jgi:protein-tyrosine phosphatase
MSLLFAGDPRATLCVFKGLFEPVSSNSVMMNDRVRVMFVCLGNICRSPLAEGIFRHHVQERGLAERIEIQSSGTGSWHIGEAADHRMRQTASRRGVPIDEHVAQQFIEDHLSEFDHILVMDKQNLNDILFFDQDDRFGGKVRLFREFDPIPDTYQVPDPYYGGASGFDEVYDIVERTSRRLLDEIVKAHGLEE